VDRAPVPGNIVAAASAELPHRKDHAAVLKRRAPPMCKVPEHRDVVVRVAGAGNPRVDKIAATWD